MFAGIDLTQIFLFPIKDAAARKNFLVGCAVALAGFIVPLVPYLFLFGYAARVVRQILDDEEPRMTDWNDWGKLFEDGAKMFGVRMAYSSPLLLLGFPIFVSGIAMPIIVENVNGSEADTVAVVLGLVMISFICLIALLSLPLGLVIPAAEMNAVDKNEFAAGFRVREWWGIFRANLGGFVAAFALFYIASMLLGIAIQIIVATLIFTCLLPILTPAVTFYSTLTMYALMAQAYKAGRERQIAG